MNDIELSAKAGVAGATIPILRAVIVGASVRDKTGLVYEGGELGNEAAAVATAGDENTGSSGFVGALTDTDKSDITGTAGNVKEGRV